MYGLDLTGSFEFSLISCSIRSVLPGMSVITSLNSVTKFLAQFSDFHLTLNLFLYHQEILGHEYFVNLP